MLVGEIEESSDVINVYSFKRFIKYHFALNTTIRGRKFQLTLAIPILTCIYYIISRFYIAAIGYATGYTIVLYTLYRFIRRDALRAEVYHSNFTDWQCFLQDVNNCIGCTYHLVNNNEIICFRKFLYGNAYWSK
jgi:hypothetical protein